MRYVTLIEILELHRRIIAKSGGAEGVRDFGLLASAVAQPKMIFAREELYPGLVEKAAALGFSLIMNHPFVDGNKRVGQAAMEVFLVLNKMELVAALDEQENVVLAVASGEMKREAFVVWLQLHTVTR